MFAGISGLLATALVTLWVVALLRPHQTEWLAWLDLGAGLAAWAMSRYLSRASSKITKIGCSLALSVFLFAAGIIALNKNIDQLWLAHLTAASGFLAFALAVSEIGGKKTSLRIKGQAQPTPSDRRAA
ncbi:hypothetical protein K2X30_13360 [bacterium]|nr:hypothetical protein [bacterium]